MREQEQAAERSADQVLLSDGHLSGWTDRTAEIEKWHDEYLQATRVAHRLTADLAAVRTELILAMGDQEALDPVCSFRREFVTQVDRATFCKKHPAEAEQCAEYVARKIVYTSRSYL
jgi:hypothetical protein